MDHKAALARIPADVTSALNERENRAGLIHLAGHVGLICLVGLWIGLKAPLWPLLLPVQGILLVFLFTLEHEATHQTPFANATFNDWVGRACGLVLLLPFEWFRYFHLAHHRHTNDPEKDPELLSGGKPETWSAYLINVSGYTYWTKLPLQLLANATGNADAPYIPDRAKPRLQREARVMLGLYLLAAISLFWTPLLFWVWLLPMLLCQPFLRFYLLAEHSRCAFVANMLENTRTTYTNRVIRFIAWNMPYHAEHHAAPQVPFHKLPALNAHLRDQLAVTSKGYASFTRDSIGRLNR